MFNLSINIFSSLTIILKHIGSVSEKNIKIKFDLFSLVRFNRQTGELSRLWCSDRKCAITRIALVETVDFMLAAGNEEGLLTIFQVRKHFIGLSTIAFVRLNFSGFTVRIKISV